MFCSAQDGKVLSNTSKVHFEGLVHMLRYIRDTKHLGLKYYTNKEDAPLFDLLRQTIIKTENQLMVLYYTVWYEWPDTVRITEAYI